MPRDSFDRPTMSVRSGYLVRGVSSRLAHSPMEPS